MKTPGTFTEIFQKSLGTSELPEAPAEPAKPELSPAEQALVASLVEDGLSIQDRFKPEPLFKQTDRGHYESRSVEELRQAKKPPPQLR